MEQGAKILLYILKHYAQHFSQSDIQIITKTCELAIELSISGKSPELEDAWVSVQNALAQELNKVAIAGIKEAESYKDMGKCLEMLAA